MAKLEARIFRSTKYLLLLSENEEESVMIDKLLGQPEVTRVTGSVHLADGYGQHYVRLSGSKAPNPDADAEESLRMCWMRHLAYSWKDINYRYEGLTPEEKKFLSEEHFKKLVRELKNEGLA